VIHAHLFEGLAVGILAKLLAFRPKIPIVMDSQGDLNAEFQTYNKESEFLRKVFVWFAKKIVGFADHIVLSSENAKPFFERFPKLKGKITVVRDGVDLGLFSGREDDRPNQELLEEIGRIEKWKGDSNVLIYTGGMEDAKGVRELLEEFLRSREQLKNWKLILFGEGAHKSEYEELVQKSNARDLVYFPKHSGFFVMHHFLRLANVSIDPKQESTEGSGKLANYMAAGLPVICFEKQFNRSRLGEQGHYISKISEMKHVLGSKDFVRVQYDLSKEDEQNEADKLHGIFRQLTTKNNETSLDKVR
jgi:glycosyltransferase involved in cell wall biosynthesis